MNSSSLVLVYRWSVRPPWGSTDVTTCMYAPACMCLEEGLTFLEIASFNGVDYPEN